MRIAAIYALKNFHQAKDIAMFIELLDDEKIKVRQAARSALVALTGKNLPAKYSAWSFLLEKSD